MPTSKRRTSAGPTAASKAKSKSQSQLAFHGKSNKVTKPSSGLTSNKTKKDPALLESISHTDLSAEAEPDLKEPTTAELSIAEQAEAEAKAPLTPEEEEASQVKDAQIKKYWLKKESLRKAPRVHQERLSLHEKVCREFDTDGRFGVSIYVRLSMGCKLTYTHSHLWELRG
jgi:DNA polymerase delta subunit 4